MPRCIDGCKVTTSNTSHQHYVYGYSYCKGFFSLAVSQRLYLTADTIDHDFNTITNNQNKLILRSLIFYLEVERINIKSFSVVNTVNFCYQEANRKFRSLRGKGF